MLCGRNKIKLMSCTGLSALSLSISFSVIAEQYPEAMNLVIVVSECWTID
jgi:hypothetical protein